MGAAELQWHFEFPGVYTTSCWLLYLKSENDKAACRCLLPWNIWGTQNETKYTSQHRPNGHCLYSGCYALKYDLYPLELECSLVFFIQVCNNKKGIQQETSLTLTSLHDFTAESEQDDPEHAIRQWEAVLDLLERELLLEHCTNSCQITKWQSLHPPAWAWSEVFFWCDFQH